MGEPLDEVELLCLQPHARLLAHLHGVVGVVRWLGWGGGPSGLNGLNQGRMLRIAAGNHMSMAFHHMPAPTSLNARSLASPVLPDMDAAPLSADMLR